MVPWVPYNPDFYLPGGTCGLFSGVWWYPSRVRMVRYGCDDELRMGLIAKDRLKTGVQSVQHSPKRGPKWSKTRFRKMSLLGPTNLQLQMQ
jgi:hypothetical protein